MCAGCLSMGNKRTFVDRTRRASPLTHPGGPGYQLLKRFKSLPGRTAPRAAFGRDAPGRLGKEMR